MTRIFVVGTLTLGALAFSPLAAGAPPARIGAYAGVAGGHTSYRINNAAAEATLLGVFDDPGVPYSGYQSEIEDSDIGYQAMFGYRFNRYVAAELSIVDMGEISFTASANYAVGGEELPAMVSFQFDVKGPVFAVIGIFPLGEHVELFGRAGLMFSTITTSSRTELGNQPAATGITKGNSQDFMLGAGVTFNLGPGWSIRAEYQQVSDVGEDGVTGRNDLRVITGGLFRRF